MSNSDLPAAGAVHEASEGVRNETVIVFVHQAGRESNTTALLVLSY